jgi:hypothetical protein
LAALRPAEEPTGLSNAATVLSSAVASVRIAARVLAEARVAADKVSQAELAVARAVEVLVEASLIDIAAPNPTVCPICEYPTIPTLTPERIDQVRARLPLAEVYDRAKSLYSSSLAALVESLHSLLGGLRRILPKLSGERAFKAQLDKLQSRIANEAVATYAAAATFALAVTQVGTAWRATAILLAEPLVDTELEHCLVDIETSVPQLAEITQQRALYLNAFADLEQSLNVEALDDVRYALRDRWLTVAGDLNGVLYAIRWEHAKAKAQELLATIRKGLIELRSEIVEDARRTFSEQMTAVWQSLRRDTVSRFSRLSIPSAKGRGYKLEIEVKAVLNDGRQDAEVDALKVLSESQINVLGIAAYITRANLLGHSVLIFDDPVQSMDEDHYRSFAGSFLASLVTNGHQVIVLTHSDVFARDIADHHYSQPGFATLRTRASRRHGCQVDEGNRRVAERLNLAEALADEGRFQDAWKTIRLALERLYVLAHTASTPGFDPRTWRNQTAEFMWENGAGDAIQRAVPECGMRLRNILTFTAAGAHDASPRGLTDIRDATAFLKSLLTPLRLGSG